MDVLLTSGSSSESEKDTIQKDVIIQKRTYENQTDSCSSDSSFIENDSCSDSDSDSNRRTITMDEFIQIAEKNIAERQLMEDEYTRSPEYLSMGLYEHQLNGLNWLIKMDKLELSSLLADKMGVGESNF